MLDTLALSALIGLACFRLTRLAQTDDIFNRQRAWLLKRISAKVANGFLCPWCLSAYVAGAILLVVWWLQPVSLPLLVWFAAWSISAAMAAWTD